MFGMFGIMEVIFPLFFILVAGFILFNIFRGVKEWSSNNQQPVLSVAAKVVSKRQHVSRHTHNHGNNMHHHHTTSSTYYVTFEVESGDRMELMVPDREYGQLVEGDIGKLTFQGTRYHGFERKR